MGSHLVRHLRFAGHAVVTPLREEHLRPNEHLGHVIYAIGLTADFRARPYETVEAHVSLLSELLQHGDFESLLYLSSTRVYARVTKTCEDEPLSVLAQDPSDLYNLSKLMGESLCLQNPRVNVRVVRLSNVVGGEDADSDNFVPSILREAIGGRVVLQTALNSAKDYIHIDDVVELLTRIAAGGRERIYNVASGVQTTHKEWISKLTAQTGCAVEVLPGASVVRFAPIDIGRIRDEFNFHPRPVLTALAKNSHELG